MKKILKKTNIFYNIYCIIYLLSIIYCIFSEYSYGERRLLVLLPLVGLSCFLLVKSNKRYFKNFSIFIINTIVLIRYAIYPATIILNNYMIESISELQNIIFLMIYELIGVVFIIFIFGKKLLGESIKNKVFYFQTPKIGTINLILLILLPCLVAIFPSILRSKNNVNSIISWIYCMGVWSLVVTIFYILRLLSELKIFPLQSICALLGILFSICYILAITFTELNVNRWLIIATGLSNTFMINYFFPKYKRKILIISTIGIFIFIFLGTFIKFKDTEISLLNFYRMYLSYESFDAYFMGIEQINFGIKMIENNPIVRTLESTLADFFGSMPLVSKFFSSTSPRTVNFYLEYLNRTDLICPTVIQSMAHFGKLGSPIIGMFFTYLAMYFNKKLNNTKDPYKMFILIELIFYCSIFFAINMSIITDNIWFRVLYLILLSINKPIKIRRKQ